jgi:deoxyribose-phosphate aldolase
MTPSQHQAILNIIPLLDLTSLNADDDEISITALCEKAQTPFGNVASVCIYPKFVKLAANTLKNTAIKIDTVVNFPSGNGTLLDTLHQIETVLAEGANEIDMVFPYHTYLQGEQKKALEFVTKAKMLSKHPFKLKVIIETGQLPSSGLIKKITQDVIQAGADFVKTSTGKTEQGATLKAAKIILTTLKEQANMHVGLKISGGIRTIGQSLSYIELACEIMGNKWVSPTFFRIGASKLLEEIRRILI